MAEGLFRAVTVGNRDPPPLVPELNQWEISSGIPPPVALLAATFRTIKAISHQVLGIQEFVVTGLDPIF